VLASAALWAQSPVPQQARDGQAQVPVKVSATALIEGTAVTGAAGQPADGVLVTLSGVEMQSSLTFVTDDNGAFSFAGLPPGTYSLRGSKTGHVSATYGQKTPGRAGTSIVLAAGQQLKGLTLTVPKGGVISGVIFDEKNRPSVSTTVRVLRWTMQSGERALVSAGTANTDDRGIYRVFGLSPGEYLVSANARITAVTMINAEIAASGQAIRVETPNSPATAAGPSSGYAAVYFPGTAQPGLAQPVNVGAGEEQLGVDFALQRVPLSKVTGQVLAPPAVPVSNVQVRLVDQSTSVPGVTQLTARPGRDGTFTFASVPPGQYLLSATVAAPASRPTGAEGAVLSAQEMARQMELQAMGLAGTPAGAGQRLWAQASVSVDGSYAPNITLSMQEGMTISGSLAFDGAVPVPSPLTRVRVTLNPHGQLMTQSGISTVTATTDANGRFTFFGVTPGRYVIRASGAAGWTVRSVLAQGKDTLDFGLEVVPGENVANVSVVLGDALSELKGTLQTSLGQPTSEYTVIIFPADTRYWVPLARRMRSTRPSTDGKFGFMGLPAGDYKLAAVTDVEPGAWFDPAFLQELLPASVSVRLVDGQPVVQDLRVSGQ
jgi:hypothetical protein